MCGNDDQRVGEESIRKPDMLSLQRKDAARNWEDPICARAGGSWNVIRGTRDVVPDGDIRCLVHRRRVRVVVPWRILKFDVLVAAECWVLLFWGMGSGEGLRPFPRKDMKVDFDLYSSLTSWRISAGLSKARARKRGKPRCGI